MEIHPLSIEIAWLAGSIGGKQAERGINVPFEDLLIGAKAVHLNYAVLTYNTGHFAMIPGLVVRNL